MMDLFSNVFVVELPACGGMRGLWNVHLCHQLFHLLLSFGPRAIVEIVECVHELRSGIETLVL
jgi:hypothetical protein